MDGRLNDKSYLDPYMYESSAYTPLAEASRRVRGELDRFHSLHFAGPLTGEALLEHQRTSAPMTYFRRKYITGPLGRAAWQAINLQEYTKKYLISGGREDYWQGFSQGSMSDEQWAQYRQEKGMTGFGWNTAFFAESLVTDVALDPLTWLTFGGWSAIKGGAKGLGRGAARVFPELGVAGARIAEGAAAMKAGIRAQTIGRILESKHGNLFIRPDRLHVPAGKALEGPQAYWAQMTPEGTMEVFHTPQLPAQRIQTHFRSAGAIGESWKKSDNPVKIVGDLAQQSLSWILVLRSVSYGFAQLASSALRASLLLAVEKGPLHAFDWVRPTLKFIKEGRGAAGTNFSQFSAGAAQFIAQGRNVQYLATINPATGMELNLPYILNKRLNFMGKRTYLPNLDTLGGDEDLIRWFMGFHRPDDALKKLKWKVGQNITPEQYARYMQEYRGQVESLVKNFLWRGTSVRKHLGGVYALEIGALDIAAARSADELVAPVSRALREFGQLVQRGKIKGFKGLGYVDEGGDVAGLNIDDIIAASSRTKAQIASGGYESLDDIARQIIIKSDVNLPAHVESIISEIKTLGGTIAQGRKGQSEINRITNFLVKHPTFRATTRFPHAERMGGDKDLLTMLLTGEAKGGVKYAGASGHLWDRAKNWSSRWLTMLNYPESAIRAGTMEVLARDIMEKRGHAPGTFLNQLFEEGEKEAVETGIIDTMHPWFADYNNRAPIWTTKTAAIAFPFIYFPITTLHMYGRKLIKAPYQVSGELREINKYWENRVNRGVNPIQGMAASLPFWRDMDRGGDPMQLNWMSRFGLDQPAAALKLMNYSMGKFDHPYFNPAGEVGNILGWFSLNPIAAKAFEGAGLIPENANYGSQVMPFWGWKAAAQSRGMSGLLQKSSSSWGPASVSRPISSIKAGDFPAPIGMNLPGGFWGNMNLYGKQGKAPAEAPAFPMGPVVNWTGDIWNADDNIPGRVPRTIGGSFLPSNVGNWTPRAGSATYYNPSFEGVDPLSYRVKHDREFHKVSRVIDADTIEIMRGGQPQSVRLRNVMAPEWSSFKKEAGGQSAAAYLRSMIKGKTIGLEFENPYFEPGNEESGGYGRIAGHVFLGDKYINAEMVRAGKAHYATGNKNKYWGDTRLKSQYPGYEDNVPEPLSPEISNLLSAQSLNFPQRYGGNIAQMIPTTPQLPTESPQQVVMGWGDMEFLSSMPWDSPYRGAISKRLAVDEQKLKTKAISEGVGLESEQHKRDILALKMQYISSYNIQSGTGVQSIRGLVNVLDQADDIALGLAFTKKGKLRDKEMAQLGGSLLKMQADIKREYEYQEVESSRLGFEGQSHVRRVTEQLDRETMNLYRRSDLSASTHTRFSRDFERYDPDTFRHIDALKRAQGRLYYDRPDAYEEYSQSIRQDIAFQEDVISARSRGGLSTGAEKRKLQSLISAMEKRATSEGAAGYDDVLFAIEKQLQYGFGTGDERLKKLDAKAAIGAKRDTAAQEEINARFMEIENDIQKIEEQMKQIGWRGELQLKGDEPVVDIGTGMIN